MQERTDELPVPRRIFSRPMVSPTSIMLPQENLPTTVSQTKLYLQDYHLFSSSTRPTASHAKPPAGGCTTSHSTAMALLTGNSPKGTGVQLLQRPNPPAELVDRPGSAPALLSRGGFLPSAFCLQPPASGCCCDCSCRLPIADPYSIVVYPMEVHPSWAC